MGYEVDFLAVGNASKSGDAIALRFGNLFGPRQQQVVVVIDAGTKQAGQDLCSHILQHYNTNLVDLVISTHPDADHASGLCEVVDNLHVKQVLMHRPWLHAPAVSSLFNNRSLTIQGLEQKIEKSLEHAKNLETLAIKRGLPIIEPFAGTSGFNNQIVVLGPSEDYYKSLLPHCRFTPDPLKFLKRFARSAVETGENIVESATEWVNETLYIDSETLDNTEKDDYLKSAENSSSTIILFRIEGKQLLFTGDADVAAMYRALNFAQRYQISIQNLSLFQVPHHGSKHNINSTILNYLPPTLAAISASKGADPKHPSRKVINALHRRRFIPTPTQGTTVCFPFNAPQRVGWGPVRIPSFFERVEV